MKSLKDYLITEKLHLNDKMSKEKFEEPFDTDKNDSGKLTPKQKEFVNNFTDSIIDNNKRNKSKELYTDLVVSYTDLHNLIGIDIKDSSDLEDFFNELRSTIYSILDFVEHVGVEDLEKQFPAFAGMTEGQIRELGKIVDKSGKLIAAIYGNNETSDDPYDGMYVTYNKSAGTYEALDIVWDN